MRSTCNSATSVLYCGPPRLKVVKSILFTCQMSEQPSYNFFFFRLWVSSVVQENVWNFVFRDETTASLRVFTKIRIYNYPHIRPSVICPFITTSLNNIGIECAIGPRFLVTVVFFSSICLATENNGEMIKIMRI